MRPVLHPAGVGLTPHRAWRGEYYDDAAERLLCYTAPGHIDGRHLTGRRPPDVNRAEQFRCKSGEQERENLYLRSLGILVRRLSATRIVLSTASAAASWASRPGRPTFLAGCGGVGDEVVGMLLPVWRSGAGVI